MVRRYGWALVLALSVACSGGAASQRKQGSSDTSTSKVPKRADKKPDSAGGTDDGAAQNMTFADCADKACMLHPETSRHHVCLHQVDGRCAHYGAPCNTSDPCIFDAKSAGYRTCTKQVEGECMSFGPACEPKSSCVYDAKTTQYRTCQRFSGGTCQAFGDSCEAS